MATVTSATNHFPTAKEGFSTTTSGSVSSGASTVGLNSTTGFSNGETVVLVIDPTDSLKKQVFTGVVNTSSNQITGVVWTEGTNQAHSAGATVVDYETATHWALYSKGLLVQHKQDGTHANTISTNTINENTANNGVTIDALNIKDGKLVTADSVVTANYTDGSILPEHLVASTGTSWAWQSYVPTFTNLTVGNGTLSAQYLQVGKTVYYRGRFVLGSTSSVGSNPQVSLPVAASTNYNVSANPPNNIGPIEIEDSGSANFVGSLHINSNSGRSNAQFIVWLAGGTYVSNSGITSTVPHTWTTNDGIGWQVAYEAA